MRQYADLTDNEKETLNGADIVSQYDTKNMPWTVKTLNNQINKDKAHFDNAVQRGEVWKIEQKSLLIHSYIIHSPVPPFYAVKNADGTYDFIDGKQRSMATHEFLEDKYALKDVPPVEFDGFDEPVDLNGLKFSELPESVRDTILSFGLTIYSMEDMEEDDVADVFMRLNNGRSLSQIEKTRVYAPSLNTLKELTTEPIFDLACTDKQRDKYYDEDTVIKLFKLFKADEKDEEGYTETDYSLDSKDIRPFMSTFEPNESEISSVRSALNTVKNIYDKINNYTGNQWKDHTQKLAKRVGKKILNRTNLVTLSYFFAQHDEVDEYDAADFLLYFFSGVRASSIDAEYNAYCRNGSGHQSAVTGRLDILASYLDKFINDPDTRDNFTEEYLEEEEKEETEAEPQAESTKDAANDDEDESEVIPFTA